MADSLSSILKTISKKYGESVVKVGVESLSVDGILSLGSPSFDFAVYGESSPVKPFQFISWVH